MVVALSTSQYYVSIGQLIVSEKVCRVIDGYWPMQPKVMNSRMKSGRGAGRRRKGNGVGEDVQGRIERQLWWIDTSADA